MKKYLLFDENELPRALEVLNSAGITPESDPAQQEDPVHRVLFEIGIPENTRGFKYAQLALEIGGIERGAVTKVLYPEIAKAFGTTMVNVEKSVRTAIERAWERGVPPEYRAYFQHAYERPSNLTFLQTVAEIVRERTLHLGGSLSEG